MTSLSKIYDLSSINSNAITGKIYKLINDNNRKDLSDF